MTAQIASRADQIAPLTQTSKTLQPLQTKYLITTHADLEHHILLNNTNLTRLTRIGIRPKTCRHKPIQGNKNGSPCKTRSQVQRDFHANYSKHLIYKEIHPSYKTKSRIRGDLVCGETLSSAENS